MQLLHLHGCHLPASPSHGCCTAGCYCQPPKAKRCECLSVVLAKYLTIHWAELKETAKEVIINWTHLLGVILAQEGSHS